MAGLVASLQPACLFVDFDRTLCSTKGGSPLAGRPSVDDELVGLCAQMEGRAHVVTRNPHVDEIRTFLAAKGLPRLLVHRVVPPRSKAEVVCDPRWLEAAAGSGAPERAGGPVVLFVDDTLGEHLDDEMRSAPNVIRFLFTRARATQTTDRLPT